MKKTAKNLFRMIVTLLLVVGWGLAASALHVAWTGQKVVIIPKDHVGFRDTYVNTSGWTADDVAAHPALCKRLLATGNGDALATAFTATTPDDLAAQVTEAINKGPAPATQPTAGITTKVHDTVEHVKASVGH